MEKFADHFRKRQITRQLRAVETKQKLKRRIFKKPAACACVIAVFTEGETLSPSDVMSRLPHVSARTVKNHLKAAVLSGDLQQTRHGEYQRPLKVQKTQP